MGLVIQRVKRSAVTEGRLYTARLKAEGVDREDLLADATKALGLEGASILGIYSSMARLNEVRGIVDVIRG